MRLEDHILIRCPSDALYRIVSDIEGHTHLLPGYLESRILERKKDTWIVQRDAVIRGVRRRWTSEVWFSPGRAIHFRQVEGPLKGMEIQWVLASVGSQTEMRIIHDLHVTPRWKGWWLERFVAKPAIEQTARLVLEAVKVAAEQKGLS